MAGSFKTFLLVLLQLAWLGSVAQIAPVLTEELLFSDPGLKGDVLFIGGHHTVHTIDGREALAKQNHDFTGFIPIDGRSDSGYVIVNHEQNLSNEILGDGGGMTVFTVYRDPASGRWRVADDPGGKFRSVDFSEVGGTFYNCGGFQTAWGTVLTAEEYLFGSGEEIYKGGMGITDTSDFTIATFNGAPAGVSIRKHENFGWMVEVDPAKAKAVRKNYNMGRYRHEGGALLPDGKTVFLTDDTPGGYIFKFVAEKANDLSVGQLYVYRQAEDGRGGRWIALPMDLRSMISMEQVAAAAGATMFNRTEWAVYHNGKVYFTETGKDDTKDEIAERIGWGAQLARHLQEVDRADGKEDHRLFDYYGRILEMDMESGQLNVFLAGGAGQSQHVANPDGLALTYIDGRPVLMINEDLNGYSHGRVPAGFNEKINEIYCLDLSLEKPGIDDLHQLAVGPMGCETTGGRFNPDGTAYFVNVQHPRSENKFPFNNSVTVAVSNIDDWVRRTVFNEGAAVSAGEAYTRSDQLTFDRRIVFEVRNQNGRTVMRGKAKTIALTGLARGRYTLFLDGASQPLVIR